MKVGSGSKMECVSCVQDPEIVEMDRRRKISWSATVGSRDSRSVDTGLNELHRITGKEHRVCVTVSAATL